MVENNLEEDVLVAKNSMPEDDPNGNTLHDAREIRWGPQHAGAKLLASQYTQGEKEKTFNFYLRIISGIQVIKIVSGKFRNFALETNLFCLKENYFLFESIYLS